MAKELLQVRCYRGSKLRSNLECLKKMLGGWVDDRIVVYGVKRELIEIGIRTIRAKQDFLSRFLG
jgi:hypothetical protein